MKFITSTLILFIALAVYSQESKYLPKGGNYEVVDHTFYSLGYSEDHEQAAWVTYELWNLEINGSYSRTEDFRKDKVVSTGSARLSDYKGSGYDRGHLAPAGDMTFSKTAMSESFYMSNMSPQLPSFNRGIWRQLESHVRTMAEVYKRIYVVTGGVLNDQIETYIGDGVAVPKVFYKALYCESANIAIAFILPHENLSGKDFMDYVYSIDSLEVLTNLDFYSQISDSKEAEIESTVDLFAWTGDEKYLDDQTEDNSNSSSESSIKKSTYKSAAVQCSGIAKSTGVRCKKRTTNSNGYCHFHQTQSKSKNRSTSKPSSTSRRCTATTKSGTRCKRTASAGSSTCWQH